MPLYEFSCARCGHDFEKIVSGAPAVTCPNCGSNETRKKISACARRPAKTSGGEAPVSGCGSCSGGNCASCHQ